MSGRRARAIYRFTREEDGLMLRIYWSSACPGCPMRKQCTTSNYRRIRRWEHEHSWKRCSVGWTASPTR